jgi:formylglycine-generating enzyme
MENAGSRRAHRRVRYAASLTMWGMAAASCGYDKLPRLAGDVPAVDAPVDGPPQNRCMGVANACGADGTASCCEAAMPVPGGTFYRSYDGIGYYDMGYPATISGFVLDRYEVTVGRFRAFVNAGLGTRASPPTEGAGAHPKLVGSGWDSAWNTSLTVNATVLQAAVKCDTTHQTWTDAPGANENKPMNCVTWYEAMAFCIWDGGYLPTEAELNYAASGGSEHRAYPWSNPSTSTTIDCTYANYKIDNPPGMYCVNGTTGAVNRAGSESPRGDGRWGHSDIAGNVWEWTLDWYEFTYPTATCNDCANVIPNTNTDRVIRGGSFSFEAPLLRVAYRANYLPLGRDYFIGLRCARTPETKMLLNP